MAVATYAVVFAFLAGTVRALMLWRASIGVEVVNVAVLGALAEGRQRDLGAMLRRSGVAPYLDVARAIGQSLVELRARGSTGKALERSLRHDAQVAVIEASRRLRRHAWLDYASLAAIAFAGFEAASGGAVSQFDAVGMAAASLLWLSNVRGARSIATRIYAGATALVDSLLKSLDRLPDFAGAAPSNQDA